MGLEEIQRSENEGLSILQLTNEPVWDSVGNPVERSSGLAAFEILSAPQNVDSIVLDGNREVLHHRVMM